MLPLKSHENLHNHRVLGNTTHPGLGSTLSHASGQGDPRQAPGRWPPGEAEIDLHLSASLQRPDITNAQKRNLRTP